MEREIRARHMLPLDSLASKTRVNALYASKTRVNALCASRTRVDALYQRRAGECFELASTSPDFDERRTCREEELARAGLVLAAAVGARGSRRGDNASRAWCKPA